MTHKHKNKTVLSTTLLLLPLVFSSCGKSKEDGGLKMGIPAKIITGNSVDWKEVTELQEESRERVNSRKVGLVDIPAIGSRCTGFLINEDTVMTNQHCISSPSWAVGVTVSFNTLNSVAEEERVKVNCSEFLGNNREFDFALLKCEGSPGSQLGWVQLQEEESSLVDEAIYVIHQNCDYYLDRGCDPSKKYSPGRILRKDADWVHDADTLGGSSGSPVFKNGSHKVVALHHAGRGNNGLGRGLENYAVPMSDVVAKMRSDFPQVVFNQTGQSDDPGQDDPTQDPVDPPQGDDNDTLAKADLFLLNQSLDGQKIDSAEDLDYYFFKLDSQTTVKVLLNFMHSQGDLDLALMAEDGKVLARSQSVSDNELIEKTLTAGNYYFVVYGYRGAQADYSIQLAGQQFVRSVEPNNSFAEAFSLELPSKVSESISDSSDRDYFQFTVGANVRVKLELLLAHQMGDLDLYLYDQDYNLVGRSTSVTDKESITGYLKTGTYYILILGYNGARGEYVLNANFY